MLPGEIFGTKTNYVRERGIVIACMLLMGETPWKFFSPTWFVQRENKEKKLGTSIPGIPAFKRNLYITSILSLMKNSFEMAIGKCQSLIRRWALTGWYIHAYIYIYKRFQDTRIDNRPGTNEGTLQKHFVSKHAGQAYLLYVLIEQ